MTSFHDEKADGDVSLHAGLDLSPESIGLRTLVPKIQHYEGHAMPDMNECCARFRGTTQCIVILEIAMLILFGFFVRYDEMGMPLHLTQPTVTTPNPNSTDTMPSTSAIITANPAAPSSVSTVSAMPQPSNPSMASTGVSVEPMVNATSPMTTMISNNQVQGDPNADAGNSTTLTPEEQQQRNAAEEAEHGMQSEAHVIEYYAAFQDIHVMMFIGFGFLMTFLKRYGFSSVGFNFLLAAFVLQWATLTEGWIVDYAIFKESRYIPVNMLTLINADFTAAAILISFGAVLGKLSALQLMIMTLIEVVAYQANYLFVIEFLQATDVGDSMVVHTFGAYFGLTVAWINYRKEVAEADEKDGSVYHSDLFSMIGTIFLWLFWPSFNSATAVDEGRLRAVVNTYYSLTASTIVTFAISALVSKDKFNMVHIQNSTLAGGVAIGTLADMIIQPWAAILVGAVAGTVSVLGFRYLTPFMSKKMKLHDTCGVNNLHGMPGLISGIGSILAAGLATEELYGNGRDKIFTAVPTRTTSQLAGYQCAATFVSMFMGIVCGAITGVILRIPIWNRPTSDEIFDDDQSWILPSEEHYDVSGIGKIESGRGDGNSMEMPSTRHHKDQHEH